MGGASDCGINEAERADDIASRSIGDGGLGLGLNDRHWQTQVLTIREERKISEAEIVWWEARLPVELNWRKLGTEKMTRLR
jgi:hypothetical protein